MNLLRGFAEFTPGFYLMLATFAAVAAWEAVRPALVSRVPMTLRWGNNFLWLVINTFFLRAVFPLLGIAWAAEVTARGWGLLPAFDNPLAFNLAAGLIAMDLAGYGGHILLHRIPWLWRIHTIHHSDVEFDCTTGFRFHPGDALFTTAIRLGVIAALGLSPVTVLIYETWAGLQNLYGHANARLPPPLERIALWLVVTPDMHRIHHSARIEEGMSNFGIVFPWWDRLFRTYRREPAGGYASMEIGLNWVRTENAWSVPKLLVAPFIPTYLPAPTAAPDAQQ